MLACTEPKVELIWQAAVVVFVTAELEQEPSMYVISIPLQKLQNAESSLPRMHVKIEPSIQFSILPSIHLQKKPSSSPALEFTCACCSSICIYMHDNPFFRCMQAHASICSLIPLRREAIRSPTAVLSFLRH
ncbi:hypothetical protein Cni_G18910 [Canna indica]|uniref:Uncharacterized protein n=1 Tax=Canna indica TaxID=4628 RepID=A0AAQ3QI24_9LILI|nr:hypothetical protein Cni_G18910 [Canna indica]